ncbi:MAG: 23S rRNA (pseudouridine(1915)-N(3))-methyltransferase RlmH [Bacteroidaceae bacterium]|nr:23S rRNA (pseudouridine(1915)-N(3))-methyltransferase RlmH [Bacteroidaceae bacterium]
MPKTILLVVGKTVSAQLQTMIDDYVGRIVHFTPFSMEVVPELKNAKSLTQEQQKTMEGKALLAKLKPGDHVVLLDEHGRQYSSLDFARYVTQKQHLSSQRVVYVVGGPYGFSREVYDRANDKLSLSPMTFSHQMIRLLFVEQYYRALTIINHLPYHHE